jgi:hypothetical protein
MHSKLLRLIAPTLALFPVALAFGACSNATDEGAEPEVVMMRLTIGAQTITVSDNGTVTGGPIAITATGTVTVSAQFLRDDGTPDPLVTDALFQLNADPANAGIVTFSRTGAFTGTLTGVSAGSTTIEFSLFHISEGHEDFGPFPVPVEVS